MSALVRQALADAANSVEGIETEPYYVQRNRVGAGYVRLDRVEYPNRFGGVAYWQIFIVGPSNQHACEEWIDANAAPLYEALAPELAVTSVRPIQITLDTGSAVRGLVVEGHREH